MFDDPEERLAQAEGLSGTLCVGVGVAAAAMGRGVEIITPEFHGPLRRPSRSRVRLGRAAEVVMADGSSKPIKDVKLGDKGLFIVEGVALS